MFNTKRKIEALQERVHELFRTTDTLFDRIIAMEKKEIPNIISCSTCKCLIRKEDAIKGESEICETFKRFNGVGVSIQHKGGVTEEYIKENYYCHNKDCKPKK